MSPEQTYLLKGLCLLAGYAFGCFLAAEIVTRCIAGIGAQAIGNGKPDAGNIGTHLGEMAGWAVLVGDILKTVLACWFCYQLAAPELEHTALLYGGIGVMLGHLWPIWRRGRGGNPAGIVCTWLILYFPITGALCCLAGFVAGLGTGKKEVSVLLSALLSIPVAFLQFGLQSGCGATFVSAILLWKYSRKSITRNREKPEASG